MNTIQKANDEKKLTSTISLSLGFVLLLLKFYAFHVTNSQSILSDALESIVNVVAGLITLIVIILASAPADKEHPYGHGKIESMASTFEGGAILFAGILIIIQSIQTLFHGARIEEVDTGLIIVIFAGLVNGVLGGILYKRGKKLNSEALVSSGVHLVTDLLTSLGVVAGLFLVKLTGLDWIDPVVAVLFGSFLIIAGGKILMRSGNILLDAHDEETVKQIGELFEKHYRPGVIQIHFTRVIRSGAHHHIDCHMVIPEFWSVEKAHDFSESFEEDVISEYSVGGELHIHLDPCRKKHCHRCELKDCPIRVDKFQTRPKFSFEELTLPMDMEY